MSLQDIARHGPFTLEAKFHLTNGTDNVEVTFDCPPGNIPPPEGMAILAEKALAAVKESLGDGWRFQRRDEFVQDRISDQAGLPSGAVKFAVPEGDFEAEWAK